MLDHAPGNHFAIANTALPAGGPYTVAATFNGDTNLSTSTGNAATGLTVTKDTTTTAISETPTSEVYGKLASVTFTAGVTTGQGETAASGDTITVLINSGAATCTVTLPATTCTIGNTALPVGGPYSVVATFEWGRQPLHLYEDSDHGAHYHQGHSHRCAHRDRSILRPMVRENSVTFTLTVTTGNHEVLPTTDTNTINVGTASCSASVAPSGNGGSGSLPFSGATALAASGTAYSVTSTYGGNTDISAAAQASISGGFTVNAPPSASSVAANAGTASANVSSGSVLNDLRQDVSSHCVRIEQ